MGDYFLITCEHGGNTIPDPYLPLFNTARSQEMLNSHRGFDPGALSVARTLAALLAAPLVASTTSRLLVDLNRSVGHPHLFSPVLRKAPAELRRQIVDRYYRPYRRKAGNLIDQAVDVGRRVIHISCHSFTPELDGVVRNADIGLLYDPARSGEVKLCKRWQAALKRSSPEFVVRRNYPYEGKNDGFTTALRRRLPPAAYIGIELEISQKHVSEAGRPRATLRTAIAESLWTALFGANPAGHHQD